MSRHDDDLGNRISGSIHDRVARLAASHLSVDDVRQRAGRIRRTRRIALAAAAVAVAAVVVPAAIVAVPRPGGDDSPRPATSGTPSPTVPAGPVDVLMPVQPERGADPGIAWMQGDLLHRPDGSEVRAARFYEQFVEVGSTLLGVHSREAERLLDIDDGEGPVETRPIVDTVVVSAGGTTAAWSGPDGSVTTAWAGGTAGLRTQPEPVRPVAITGEDTCQESEGGGCTVFLNRLGEGRPLFTTSHGIEDVVTPDAVSVNDAHGTLVAAQTAYRQGRACSELFDASSASTRWRTCDHALGRFAPDGEHLIAIPSDADGLGPASVSVLDTGSGEAVATYTVEKGFVGATAWEDDGHLLLVRYSYDTGSWDVVRVDLAGHVERAAEPVASGDDSTRPLTLAGNR